MRIRVRVHTGQKKERIEKIPTTAGRSDEKFECFIKEKPKNNLANKKLLLLLSDYFRVPRNSLKITKGHHSPNKIISYDKII